MNRFQHAGTTLVAALLFALSFSTNAENAHRAPTDPNAAAPPLRYQSPFEGYTPPVAEMPTPAKNWRAINEEIAKNGGMGMGSVGMAMEGMKGMNQGAMKMDEGGDMKGMKSAPKDEMKGMKHRDMQMKKPAQGSSGEMKGMKNMKSMKSLPDDKPTGSR